MIFSTPTTISYKGLYTEEIHELPLLYFTVLSIALLKSARTSKGLTEKLNTHLYRTLDGKSLSMESSASQMPKTKKKKKKIHTRMFI